MGMAYICVAYSDSILSYFRTKSIFIRSTNKNLNWQSMVTDPDGLYIAHNSLNSLIMTKRKKKTYLGLYIL